MTQNKNNKDDADLFRATMNDVTPMSTDTAPPQTTPLKPKVRSKVRLQPEKRVFSELNHSTSDSFFAFDVDNKTKNKLLEGHYSCDATLDLHGCNISTSERLLAEFMHDCQHQQIQAAKIIHGQGHHSKQGSVLKPAVLFWLSQQQAVRAYCSAVAKDGGLGASYILL